MSWTADQNAICSRFLARSIVPTLDWSDFNLPLVSVPALGSGAASVWARLSIAPVVSGVPLGIGHDSPSVRRGLIQVQHFSPVGVGEATLSTYVDDTRNIFHRADFSGVRCGDSDEPRRVGVDATGAWWQVNAVIPYRVEERSTNVTGTFDGAMMQTFTQLAHGLAVGDVVYRTGGAWVKARANAEGTLADGVVVAVGGTDYLTVAMGGFNAWTHGLGSSGYLYLSQGTAGAMTTSAPASGLSQRLGRIVASNVVLLNIEQGMAL